LSKLQQAGKVTRIGSDKTGHWEVHKWLITKRLPNQKTLLF
jgi:hypothetical protein